MLNGTVRPSPGTFVPAQNSNSVEKNGHFHVGAIPS